MANYTTQCRQCGVEYEYSSRSGCPACDQKKDPFDVADYYDCDDTAEELTHSCPEEAIEYQLSNTADAGDTWEQMIESCAPVMVYAWKRTQLDPKWCEREAKWFVERHLPESWVDNEYGDPDGSDDDIFGEGLVAKIAAVLREHIKPEDVWACERCGEREYSAEQLREMFADEIAAESSGA